MRAAGGADVDVPCALEEGAAFAIGIVDPFDRTFDPVNRALGEFKEETVAFRIESVKRVERLFDACGPATRLVVADMAARLRRLVDRLAEARGERLLVEAVAR